MGRKSIIKVLIMVLMVWILRELEWSKSVKADESAPTLIGKPIRWELGSGIYMNNHKYVALEHNGNNQQFLLDQVYGDASTEWLTANQIATNFRSSAMFNLPERNVVTKSALVQKPDLTAALEGSGTLKSYYAKVGAPWWTGDSSRVSGIQMKGYVYQSNINSQYLSYDYEQSNGSACVSKTLVEVGWAPSSRNWGIEFGRVMTRYDIPDIYLESDQTVTPLRCVSEAYKTEYYLDNKCTMPRASYANKGWFRLIEGINVVDATFTYSRDLEPIAGKCYYGYGGQWVKYPTGCALEKGSPAVRRAGEKVGGSKAYNTQSYYEKACEGPQTSPSLGIRPAITLDPQSYIIASIPISETPDTSVSSTLTKYTQPKNEMVAGTDYKFQLFDSTQQVTKVSKPSTTQDNLFAVKDNKVQVELGTTEVTLDASVKGAHNYISAMATDKEGSTTLYGQIGSGTAATNSITLDISKIMDTSVVGEKQVNLYSEQINPNTYSDLVSSTPLTVTFEVLPPKSDQILTLDENNATEMMYGDEVTLKAYVNAEDKDLGWATAADTDTVFALVGDDAINHVTIVKQSFDSTTGIAEVTLKAISGEDAQVQLSVNKKGSHEQRYNDASEVLTPKITIKKREITVTPKKTILQVGDPYPPTWRFDTKMTDTNNKAAALVNGDKLPYTVSISPLKADVNEPTVDASGNVSAENMDKTWKLSVADDPGSDVVSFEKNYLVVRNDYHETKNKKSILEVAKLAYEGMEFIVQPDDVKTLVDEEYTFTAKATYPLEKGDGTPLTLVEQKVQYQWQQSLDGVNWENVTDGSVNAEYLDGVATFTFTSTKNLEVKDMQYRCIAKNLRDEADNVTAKSDPAGLQVTTEPVTFIMIPKEVEMVDKDKTIAENKKTKEADVIKLYDFDNVVSKNTETKQQVPSGVFDIYAPEKFYLTKDAVEEKQNDKKYEVTVYRSDGKELSETAGLLMSLDYTNKQQDTFRLTTPVSRMKDVGTYIGIMTFTIKYTPSGGS